MSSRRDPPPVLVVCCGRRLQVCIDNQVECPECGALHWVDHGQRLPEDTDELLTDGGVDDPSHGVVLDEVPDVVTCRGCQGRAPHVGACLLEDARILIDEYRCRSCREAGWIVRDLDLAEEVLRRGVVLEPDPRFTIRLGAIATIDALRLRIRGLATSLYTRAAFRLADVLEADATPDEAGRPRGAAPEEGHA